METLINYDNEFLVQLNKQLAVYVTIGGKNESPMWFQYTGTNEDNTKLIFKSSQVDYMFFEIPLNDEDTKQYFDFDSTYEHFRKLKYEHIKKSFPTVYYEVRKNEKPDIVAPIGETIIQDTAKSKETELQSFHYAFQITKSIVFEVSYYRLGNNKEKHFSTSAAEFNRPKSDYNQCGQAQNDLLKGFKTAMEFYKKWDYTHIKDLSEDEYNDMRMDIEGLKKKYNFIERLNSDNDFRFSDCKDLSKQPLKGSKIPVPRLTDEQKNERKAAKEREKENARIEAEKAQKEVESMTISIEWKKSRMWGNCPSCEAIVVFKDGSRERSATFKASGCGYDKESTVIADVFNSYLKYKLYSPAKEVKERYADIRDNGFPYGVTCRADYKSYNGGVGTSCYYAISEAIGGKLEHTANGKTFDVYTYTDNK